MTTIRLYFGLLLILLLAVISFLISFRLQHQLDHPYVVSGGGTGIGIGGGGDQTASIHNTLRLQHQHPNDPVSQNLQSSKSRVYHRPQTNNLVLKKEQEQQDVVVVVAAVHAADNHPTSSPNSTTTTTKAAAATAAAAAAATTTNIPPYHLVFSTSCEDQQDWESYVLFYHAWKVGQRGTVTRIASGCSDEQGRKLSQFHQEHIATMTTGPLGGESHFKLHLTPDFSRSKEYIKTGKSRYKYMNKPYGLLHWLEHTFSLSKQQQQQRQQQHHQTAGQPNETTRTSPDDLDGIVILMDPDMILLRPIVHDYTHQEVMFVENDNPRTKVVKHGFPMAQQDGYLNSQWMGLDVNFITNGKGNISHISPMDGPKYYNTGPPYLATVKDMYAIAQLWTDYAPRVYEIHPKLFAEMYGYIFATTQLNLPHTLIRSLVVSTTASNTREGWSYIDNDLPDDQICPVLESIPTPFAPPPSRPSNDTDTDTDLTSTTRLPVALHYCKRYLLDTWFFSKYRLKKKYISCETPILQMPPLDLAQQKYTYSLQPPPDKYDFQKKGTWDPPRLEITIPNQARREAFMLCQLIRAVNEAAMHFKRTACSNATGTTTTNWNTNYTFFNDPNMY